MVRYCVFRREKSWAIAFGSLAPILKPADSVRSLRAFPIRARTSPARLLASIAANYDSFYLLESLEGPKRLARYSMLGFDPQSLIRVKEGIVELEDPSASRKEVMKSSAPMQILSKLIASQRISDLRLPLVGGAIGYISYDAVRYLEKIPTISKGDTGFPDIELGIYYDGILFDHRRSRVYYYTRGRNRYDEAQELARGVPPEGKIVSGTLKPNTSKPEFETAVSKAKDYIAAGDIFQVVISKQLEGSFHGDLVAFYRRLSRINPSPYMYFVRFGRRSIVGASPEMLVRVEARRIETYPIAGTRPLTGSTGRDEKLRRELARDPKERAEHVMLLDLARNDVGKVSEFGSVKVTERMKIHRFSHVQHMVSRVVGKLRADQSSIDAFRAVFPAGTVSGAPKPRAMEIIEELEPLRRGPYAGAIGYFSFNGNADFAITIRTASIDAGRLRVQAGAGIVADSDPEREWFEAEQKAKVLVEALNGGVA